MIGVACEDNPSKFPIDIDELQKPENTGGFLRVIDITGAFDLLDIPNQSFDLTIEADDAENGGQLESVDFYVAYSDNEAQTIGDIAETADPILSVPASDFSINEESGLPRTSISINATTAMSALGLAEDDLGVNASFDFRWVLNLTNGKSFSAENTGLNVAGGAFFNSPFQRGVILGVQIPEDQFVGTYQVIQGAPTTSGPSAAFRGGWVFEGTTGDGITTVELSIDPNNTLNGRVFTENYLDFGESDWSITLTRDPFTGDNITVWNDGQPTGVSCASQILLGTASTPGEWTTGDDSQLTMTLIEDPTQDCGAGAPEVSFDLIKQ